MVEHGDPGVTPAHSGPPEVDIARLAVNSALLSCRYFNMSDSLNYFIPLFVVEKPNVNLSTDQGAFSSTANIFTTFLFTRNFQTNRRHDSDVEADMGVGSQEPPTHLRTTANLDLYPRFCSTTGHYTSYCV
jgi:hypothetical protein